MGMSLENLFYDFAWSTSIHGKVVKVCCLIPLFAAGRLEEDEEVDVGEFLCLLVTKR